MKTVLILEDEPSLMMLMRQMLKQYNVLEAYTAEEALRQYKDNNLKVGLLIADVTLPIGSGIQVALVIRLENPDLPVILTSGYPLSSWLDRDIADLERLRSNSVIILQKPFPAQLLLNSVRELIGAMPAERASPA